MKLAVQSDCYIRGCNSYDGLKRLKEIGYQKMVYFFSERYNEPFTTEWTEEELNRRFSPMKEVVEQLELEIPFTVIDNAIYNDLLPSSFDARKKMCIQALKATAYMGCKVLGVKPVSLYQSTPDSYERTKQLSYEIFAMLKEEADKLGVKLAFVNNNRVGVFSLGDYAYGCRISELLELANAFDAGIIIDPVNAHLAGERIEDLLKSAGERLVGFLIRDIEQDQKTMPMPMMGVLDYHRISRQLVGLSKNAVAVMVCAPTCKRYAEFLSRQTFMNTLDTLLFQMGNKIIGATLKEVEL